MPWSRDPPDGAGGRGCAGNSPLTRGAPSGDRPATRMSGRRRSLAMAIDTLAPRSRRSLLTGVAGALAGAAAATMAGAQRVLAAGDDGTAMVIAGIYDDAQNTTGSSTTPTTSRRSARGATRAAAAWKGSAARATALTGTATREPRSMASRTAGLAWSRTSTARPATGCTPSPTTSRGSRTRLRRP